MHAVVRSPLGGCFQKRVGRGGVKPVGGREEQRRFPGVDDRQQCPDEALAFAGDPEIREVDISLPRETHELLDLPVVRQPSAGR